MVRVRSVDDLRFVLSLMLGWEEPTQLRAMTEMMEARES